MIAVYFKHGAIRLLLHSARALELIGRFFLNRQRWCVDKARSLLGLGDE